MLQPLDKAVGARNDSWMDSRFGALQRRVESGIFIRRAARLIAQSIILLALVCLFLVRAPQVQGLSMLPNIGDGTHVLINTLAYAFNHPVARGDIVAFERGSGDDRKVYLKRVVGLPGDRVALTDGRVIINGTLLDEPYKPVLDRTNMTTFRVQSGAFFVLGDNRSMSDDSRLFGPVPRSAIIGKALWIVWPLDRCKPVR